MEVGMTKRTEEEGGDGGVESLGARRLRQLDRCCCCFAITNLPFPLHRGRRDQEVRISDRDRLTNRGGPSHPESADELLSLPAPLTAALRESATS